MLRLADRTSARLRKAGLLASTISVKIRESDFTTCTRQAALRPPSTNTDVVYDAARRLLSTWLAQNPGARIRLLGVGGSSLNRDAQGDLFSEEASGDGGAVDRTLDEIRERFGDAAVSRARSLDSP